jgi:hypothetical protein
MKIDDTLSEVFNTIPQQKELEVIDNNTGEIVKTAEGKIETDYDTSRENLRELLIIGQNALNHALEVAKQSEHPRAFEVVGNMMKQLDDVNQQLMDLHQQKQKLDAPVSGGSKKEVTNNNVIFTGSTAELNKLIKNMSKGE